MTEIEDEVKTEFKFSELDQSAKDHAIQKYAAPDRDWWDCTYEYYKTDAEIKERGFDIDDINFSGFSSQGDGACWKGRVDMRKFLTAHMTEPEDAAKLAIWQALYDNGDLSPYMEISRNSTFYSHSNTMSIHYYGETYYGEDTTIDPRLNDMFAGANAHTLYEAVGGDDEHNRIYEWALEQARELADRIYKDLESEYDGYFEEESFADHADCNDWKFDEDGDMI